MHNDVQWVEILFLKKHFILCTPCVFTRDLYEVVILRKYKNLKKFLFKRMETSSIKKTPNAMISNYYYGVSSPNWHEGGYFPPPCPFWTRFCQLNYYQKFPNFLEVKIDINQVNLTSCHTMRKSRNMNRSK